MKQQFFFWIAIALMATVPCWAGKSSNDVEGMATATAPAKAGTPYVTVSSSNPSIGSVAIDTPDNAPGDTVTLTATASKLYGSFMGWSKNDDATIVSHDNPLTVSVQEVAHYIAHFSDNLPNGGGYFRIQHQVDYRRGYLGIIGNMLEKISFSSRDLTNTTNIETFHPNEEYDPRTILYITGNKDNKGGLTNAVIEGQGANTYSISMQKLYIDYNNGNKGFYRCYAKVLFRTLFFKDYKKPCISLYNGPSGEYWDIQPVNENTADTYLFGAKPASACQDEHGNYYATMYTSFPYRCYAPDSVEAYIVTAIDNSTQSVMLQKIESGVVPARTPVILKCKSTEPSNNRLIPLPPGSGETLPATNLLKGNLGINTSKFKPEDTHLPFDASKMMVLSNHELSFKNENVDSAATKAGYIQHNTCYLDKSLINNPLDTYYFKIQDEQSLTLAGLAKQGSAGKDYTVTGKDLELVTDFQAQNGDGYLVVKDNDQAVNNYVAESEMSASTYPIEGRDQKAYPQNNWLLVKCAPELYATFKQEKKQVTSITGQYIDPTNPTLAATGLVTGEPAEYTPNTYCATNFMGSPTVHTGEQATQPGEYFFMTPKPCEWIKMVYAVPSEDCMTFYVPVRNGNGTINGHDFSGGVRANWDYNIKPLDATLKSALSPTGAYAFHAIVKRVPSPAGSPAIAPKEGSISSQFVIYPLDITAGIVTGVSDVQRSKTVTRVRYYSLQGVESKRPHEGINVVVTTYSDGSRQVTKRKY